MSVLHFIRFQMLLSHFRVLLSVSIREGFFFSLTTFQGHKLIYPFLFIFLFAHAWSPPPPEQFSPFSFVVVFTPMRNFKI